MGNNKGNSFQLKADFFPMTILKLASGNIEDITAQLTDTIDKAPKYLVNAPIIIDIYDITNNRHLDLPQICKLLRKNKIMPVGIRGLDESDKALAITNGLVLMKGGQSPSLADGGVNRVNKNNAKAVPTQIIHKPVRSGSQIYAKDTDIIVLSSVNPGAEIIADGNIHVYGALKGRALAGASGNENARIFCKSLDSELISIAGQYLVNKKAKPAKSSKPIIQIYLQQDQLQIESI
jgi:septum site-determining protein MinC